MESLTEIIKANKQGQKCGVYSVCSANRLVLEAAILQAKKDNTALLIEATSNQVNQYGGYTGMLPENFRDYVFDIAADLDFPRELIWLGGDHLGPNCWQSEPADQAMDKSRALIRAYVAAGFTKIHLDASMSCADDPVPLSDEMVARRAADLCTVAEQTAIECFGQSQLVYVIGTEVPVPGGEAEDIKTIHVTTPERASHTLDCHRNIFNDSGLQQVWDRVVGLVVQPGVEFDHTTVIDYERTKAKPLSQFIKDVPGIAFEAHSTDYQAPEAYADLVEDHFAILKVGPQLTFAMREAIYSLAHIEDLLIPESERSHICSVMEDEMLTHPENWEKYYSGNEDDLRMFRIFSYSDRIRYYWGSESVEAALNKLLGNLDNKEIPMPVISQYLPDQYQAIRKGEIHNNPRSLIHHRIMQVTSNYAKAC
ncbi:D-tagatose-bisphosphate aldolase, class II, non-catalytic subunit [Endozoicomonas lisbonensis]|uniref:D-tagatose-1,6-bisphosphate aldolase subunit GatZ/KbaZ n=1 Tax=Endozoicomonas lisbonensis TaxID=3120522 RepID=A0ABV2SB08_9GAMM